MVKFYICEICGNLVSMINPSGVTMQCCGQDMTHLIPETTDGMHEKHIPICKADGNTVTVTVSSTDHPMDEKHYIEWIAIKTKNGTQRKILKPGDKPCTAFALTDDDSLVAAYAYCNLHGLWMQKCC